MTTNTPYTIKVSELRSMLQEVDDHIDDLSKDEFVKMAALFEYELAKAGKFPSYYKLVSIAARVYTLGKLAGIAVATSKEKESASNG